MLDEEVNEGDESREEGSAKELSVLESGWVSRAQGKAAQGPGKGCNKVGDHEDVVPVVVVSRRDVGPSSAGQGAEDANTSDEFGQRRVGSAGQNVPKGDQRESRTYVGVQHCRLGSE